MENSFEQLNLNKDIIKGIYTFGYIKPSNIQIKGITLINSNNDCIIQSQSGTGKTATYLLGALNKIEYNTKCQCIIISPTRELSAQILKVATELSTYTNIKICNCIGGTKMYDNINDLNNSNVLIGTLGRIYHIIFTNKYNIKKLKVFILDEADELIKNGIDSTLESIFLALPKDTQKILISATITAPVFNLGKKYLMNPEKILLKHNEVIASLISQFYINVETEEQKFEILLDLYNMVSASQAVIFCNTIEKVIWLEKNLLENNFPIIAMHSGMDNAERKKTMDDFISGSFRLLLTTDLLSRGIDIPQINMVINYDLPHTKEIYVHRIGRCGRFDRKGISISIINTKDYNETRNLDRLINNYEIDIKEMPDDLEKYL